LAQKGYVSVSSLVSGTAVASPAGSRGDSRDLGSGVLPVQQPIGSAIFRPSHYGHLAMQAESDDESEVISQLSSTRYPEAAAAGGTNELPSGGACDELLLATGKSLQFLLQLVDLFKNDPPTDLGSHPGLSGQFHSQRNVYGTQVCSPKAVHAILGMAAGWWGEGPNILRLTVPSGGRVIVVGDTHGQMEDVIWVFFKYGVPSKTNRYLFVGDIVDRGGHALDILLLLFAFKRDEPDSVQIIRGNHEDANIANHYGFQAELTSKFGVAGGWLFHFTTTQVFPHLPIAATVSEERRQGRSAFVVHGGVPVGGITIELINKLNRRKPSTQLSPGSHPEDEVLFNLLWSDPIPGERPKGPREKTSRGIPFVAQDTFEFCRANDVSCVIRAHQPPRDLRGFQVNHQGRCVTVFSASNYTGTTGNRGGVLICDHEKFGPQGLQPAEHWAPAWPMLASVLKSIDIVASTPAQRWEVAKRIEAQICAPAGAEASCSAGVSGSATRAPGSAAQQASQQVAPALLQVENRMIEVICQCKEQLHKVFAQADPQSSGVVPFREWLRIMGSIAMPEALEALAEKWQLGNTRVEYVPFLHRFQIVSELAGSSHVDVFRTMAQLGLQLSDVQCDTIVHGLDSDMNGTITLPEFQGFLAKNALEVPGCQAAALFEALTTFLARSPTIDDVMMAIALISSSPGSTTCISEDWGKAAAVIGKQLSHKESGRLVSFFCRADRDFDGYLKLGEIRDAFAFLSLEERQLEAFVKHIDCQGVANDRVSLIEFLRGVGDPQLKRHLQSAILQEVLKPVYFYRAALESIFLKSDPMVSNQVTVEQFRAGVQEIVRQEVAKGRRGLTDSQVDAVCEIACKGSRQVKYHDFLQSLRAVDTLRRGQRTPGTPS